MLATLALLATLGAAEAPTLTIEHTPPGVCSKGEAVVIGARIVSRAGRKVFEPAVFVRAIGAKDFLRYAMQPGGAVDTFVARLPGELTQRDLEYFIEAFDDDGKGPFRQGSPEAPLRLSALPPPPPAPQPALAPQSESQLQRSWRSPVSYAGITVLAAGVASLVGCGVVGGLALKDHNDQQAAADRGDQVAWQAARDATHSKAAVADALLGVGIAAAAVGTGLTIWGVVSRRGTGAAAVSVGASAGPGVAAAFVSGQF